MNATHTDVELVEDDEPAEATESPESTEDGDEGNELDDDLSAPQEPAESVEPQLTEKEIEKRVAACEKLTAKHRDAISRVLAESVTDFSVCPLCLPWAAGFLPPVPPEPHEWDAITAAVYGQAVEQLEKADDANMCQACKGKGNVLTGSVNPHHRTKMCRHCNGAGYQMIPGPTTAPAPLPVPEGVAPTLAVAPEPLPDADPWGRTPDDPNYGRMPNFVR